MDYTTFRNVTMIMFFASAAAMLLVLAIYNAISPWSAIRRRLARSLRHHATVVDFDIAEDEAKRAVISLNSLLRLYIVYIIAACVMITTCADIVYCIVALFTAPHPSVTREAFLSLALAALIFVVFITGVQRIRKARKTHLKVKAVVAEWIHLHSQVTHNPSDQALSSFSHSGDQTQW